MNTWQDDAEIGWETLSWDNEIRWFASKQEHGRKRVMGGVLGSCDRLIRTVENADTLGWDLYLQLNPTRACGIKAKREDVLFWRYAVLDFDPDGTSLAPPAAVAFDHHQIFSGRGYQFWLPISDTGQNTEPVQAERLMNGWLHAYNKEYGGHGWKIDTACSDLARVVRCPGSVNQKTGKRARYLIGHSTADGFRIGPRFMSTYLRPEPPPVQKFEGGTASIVDLLPHLNGTATTFLLYGVESGRRHNACYAACKNLHEIGVSSYHALGHLAGGAARCYEMDAGVERHCPLALVEVERIVKRVYADGE